MSYIYQSRQLHPRACSLGMGFVGPDQPWSRENAGRAITEANKSCPAGSERFPLRESATPKKPYITEECFETGRVFEASKAGNPRRVEWCCPKPVYLPKRALTRDEMDQYGGQCGLMRGASGEYKPEVGSRIPEWRDPNVYTSSSNEFLGVRDKGYELYCMRWRGGDIIIDPITGEKKWAAHMTPNTKMAPVSLDPAVLQQHDEARQQELARRESIIQQSAVPEGTFVERYGFPLLLIAGTVGIGVTAALFKRFSVASKQAKDAKAAAEAVKKNPDEWWPPQSVGERWYGPSLRPGSELDIVPLGDDFFEVYFKNHVGGRRRYLGNIHDEGIGRWRYRAKSPHGHEGTHQNINDAATWLAQRSWRVIKGER